MSTWENSCFLMLYGSKISHLQRGGSDAFKNVEVSNERSYLWGTLKPVKGELHAVVMYDAYKYSTTYSLVSFTQCAHLQAHHYLPSIQSSVILHPVYMVNMFWGNEAQLNLDSTHVRSMTKQCRISLHDIKLCNGWNVIPLFLRDCFEHLSKPHYLIDWFLYETINYRIRLTRDFHYISWTRPSWARKVIT